jgi:FK506-binding protein 2
MVVPLLIVVLAACGADEGVPESARPIPVAAEVVAGHDVHVEVIRPGEGPREVAEGDRLRVRYRLRRARDGKLLESSDSRGRPFVATLKQPDVIEGWVRGLVGMRAGEVRRVQVPASLAYGDDGEWGNDVLVFDIEMLGWIG